MKLQFEPFLKMAADINKQSVVVGVLDKQVTAASADYKKPVTTMSTLSGSTKRRYAKRKGRQNNIKLRKLAFILDAKKGIFSTVFINAKNQDLIDIAELFAKPAKSEQDVRRLQNIARALVRNPILRKDYNPNKPSTIKKKGFNHWGFQTGTLFKNIKAVYYKR